MALPNLAMDYAVYTLIYSIKPRVKAFIKMHLYVMTDASLNKVMTVVLKLEENF